MTRPRTSGDRPYSDPYLAGVGLGLVLLASYVLAARGLGASGAFSSVAAAVVQAVSPEVAADSPLLARRLAGGSPWGDWLVFEILGLLAGGFVSALLAGRLGARVERGSQITSRLRVTHAVLGGAAMGAGAVLARGCTSGLALSGGALLSAGAWMFIAVAFTAAYLVSPFTRKAWR